MLFTRQDRAVQSDLTEEDLIEEIGSCCFGMQTSYPGSLFYNTYRERYCRAKAALNRIKGKESPLDVRYYEEKADELAADLHERRAYL